MSGRDDLERVTGENREARALESIARSMSELVVTHEKILNLLTEFARQLELVIEDEKKVKK